MLQPRDQLLPDMDDEYDPTNPNIINNEETSAQLSTTIVEETPSNPPVADFSANLIKKWAGGVPSSVLTSAPVVHHKKHSGQSVLKPADLVQPATVTTGRSRRICVEGGDEEKWIEEGSAHGILIDVSCSEGGNSVLTFESEEDAQKCFEAFLASGYKPEFLLT